MELRIVTVGELKRFVEEPSFAKLTNIPISPLRAFSQEQNPNALPTDPALIVAYDSDMEVLAYLGCLPDRLAKNLSEKICWSSCWWVHPTKGNEAVMSVFYKGLQLWDAKMLFDALPERSIAILEKMGYFSFQKINGIHAFLRFKLHKIIPARIPLLAPLKNVFYVLDTLLNLPVQVRLAFWKRKNKLSTDILVQRILEVDDTAEIFIKSLAEQELVHRNSATFNWIIKYPWLSSNKKHTASYHFSSQANHFENILLQIHQKERLVGFLWLTLRDGTAKLPYCYVIPGMEDIVVKVLTQKLIALPVDTFICFQENILPTLTKSKAPFLLKKEVFKTFGWTKTLDHYFESFPYIQDGDGDGVFT